MARTQPLPKSRYLVYLERAKEFSKQMERAASERAWNSVGLLGVHSVISACDALTIRLGGRRWRGQSHSGVLDVVRDLNLSDPDPLMRQIADILEMKSEVEYEDRVFTEKEAVELKRTSEQILSSILRRISTS